MHNANVEGKILDILIRSNSRNVKKKKRKEKKLE